MNANDQRVGGSNKAMKSLSNELLIEAYEKAVELQLDEEFQFLLKKELLRRKIDVNNLAIFVPKSS
mgnify:CR=1 FL=1